MKNTLKIDDLLALSVSGLGAFTKLDAAPRRFKKEVLHVGRWIHPATGEALDFDKAFLEQLAKDTNHWIELGNKVWFPAGHTSDVCANLGFWPRFEVDGERLVGVVEVLDERGGRERRKDDPGRLGGDPPGRRREHGRATHGGDRARGGDPGAGDPGPNQLRSPRTRGRSSSMDPLLDLAPIRGALGLEKDASASAIVEAIEALKATPKVNVEKLSREIEAKVEAKFSKELHDLRLKAAEREVELAREESIRIGSPIDEDTRKDAVALLARGDPESERLGRKLLALAKAPRDTKGLRILESPSTKKDEEKEKDREEVRKQMLLARGYRLTFKKDGRIKRAIPPHSEDARSSEED